MSIDRERILTNLRKGVLEFCVLAQLENGRSYGFDLARTLQTAGLLASDGALYPLLARLRSRGLVEADWEISDSTRPRKYYELTGLGVEHLGAFREVWPPLRDAVDATLSAPDALDTRRT